jgi:lysozyme
MVANSNFINLIKSFEGLYLNAYHDLIDPPGVDTIGYGTIQYPPTYLGGKHVKVGDPKITEDQAIEFLMWEVNVKTSHLPNIVHANLTPNQWGAIISFEYNLGEGALESSTLLKEINSNPNNPDIRNQFLRWDRASGKEVPGLERRRIAEADLYFTA